MVIGVKITAKNVECAANSVPATRATTAVEKEEDWSVFVPSAIVIAMFDALHMLDTAHTSQTCQIAIQTYL